MLDDPTPFRLALQEQALARDWANWNVTRLVFADWLEDHDRAEQYVARAEWKLAWHKPGIWVFEVWGPVATNLLSSQRRKLLRRQNQQALLGFLPGSLRLLGYSPPQGQADYRYDFSWCPKRSLDTFADGTFSGHEGIRLDTDLPNLSAGFASLWVPRVQVRSPQGELFPEDV